MESFDTLPIIPLGEDLFAPFHPLPVIALGTHYSNALEYLGTLFHLVKEDCIASFRHGIQHIRQTGSSLQPHLHVYPDATVLDVECQEACGMAYNMGFRPQPRLFPSDGDESSNKCLKFGALLCISDDNFRSFLWAVVCSSNIQSLRRGRVLVRCIGDPGSKLRTGHSYSMAESTSSYFEAYAHVLKNLQRYEMRSLPFSEHLLTLANAVAEPLYISRRVTRTYNLECVFAENRKARAVDILSPWPKMSSSLDQSQQLALKHGLTKKLALIQGPPGTGKTHVGLLLTKVLLSNLWTPPVPFKNRSSVGANSPDVSGPLLILCFTNHALDQFLEGIYDYEKSLVRYGSRSGSAKLQSCMMQNRRADFWQRTRRRGGWENLKLLEQKKEIRDTLGELSKEVARCKAILAFPYVTKLTLKGIASQHQIDNLFLNGHECDELLKMWLEGLDPPTDEYWDDEKDAPPSDEACDKENLEQRSNVLHKVLQYTAKLFANKAIQQSSASSLKDVTNSLQCLALKGDDAPSVDRLLCESYPWTLSKSSRLRLHDHWLKVTKEGARKEMMGLAAQYELVYNRKNELGTKVQISVLKQAKVVGMTTSAAARRWDILMELRPEVVIVEEAAEVLEAHIVASLTPHTKHLVLIGDHKQLRPSVAEHRLGVEHNLDVSMFERLVGGNVEHRTLGVQRRMRPPISKLLRQFYPDLRNHESVSLFEDVRGVKKNVFFFDHEEQEEAVKGAMSKKNSAEAEMVAGLARYLTEQQGYKEEEVTVLTMYSGQKELIARLVGARAPPKWGTCQQPAARQGIRVTSVDDFQGEESEIVILSLVRCNNRRSIGFVGNANRVCVALSRARKGLYIFGSAAMLADQSPVWRTVIEELSADSALGRHLDFCCPNHPTVSTTSASSSADFQRLVRDGVCKQPCPHIFECGHACPRPCHYSPDLHLRSRCTQPCPAKLDCLHMCASSCHVGSSCPPCFQRVQVFLPACGHYADSCCSLSSTSKCRMPCDETLPCGHKCQNLCGQECTSICTSGTRAQLPCQHEAILPCHMATAESISAFECQERVVKTLPCGHSCSVPCDPIRESSFLCTREVSILLPCGHNTSVECHRQSSPPACQRACMAKLPCGHVCRGTCGRCQGGKSHVACQKECNAELSCGHVCKGACASCQAGMGHVSCGDRCARGLPCGHRCKRRCGEKCGPCVGVKCQRRCSHARCVSQCGQRCKPCERPCEWKCEHFRCGLACKEVCTRPRCNEACRKALPCGHPCIGMCGEPCPTRCRVCDPCTADALCGQQLVHMPPSSRFIQLLDCGHICEVTALDQYMDRPFQSNVLLKRW